MDCGSRDSADGRALTLGIRGGTTTALDRICWKFVEALHFSRVINSTSHPCEESVKNELRLFPYGRHKKPGVQDCRGKVSPLEAPLTVDAGK